MKAVITLEVQMDEDLCQKRGVDPVDFVKNHLQVESECGIVFLWPKDMPSFAVDSAKELNQDIIQGGRIITSIITQRKKVGEKNGKENEEKR